MEEETPHILIVDDDLDFASLLSDVFSQASYEVEVTGDPTKVEELIRSTSFSLVVTDLRMPGLDGFELAKKIRAINPEIPIIMVSGFLENKDREKLEAHGIVGLYEKPLSVFSLLKNAAKLISDSKARKRKGADSGSGARKGDAAAESHGLEFPFSALPCRSPDSLAFAESIYRLRNRKPNLCMIAPPGTPTRAIAADFFRWLNPEECGFQLIEPNDVSEERLVALASEASEKGWSNLVICIPETDRLDPAQQKQLARSSRKGALRERWEGHIRFLFIISTDVETLYQEGVLSDELYLSMGGTEIHVPALKDCPEDIEFLAANFQTESGIPLKWEPEALKVLRERDWPGNHAELRKILLRFQQGDSTQPIRASEVLERLSDVDSTAEVRVESEIPPLRETLKACGVSYLEGLSKLLGKDIEKVASIAGIQTDLAERIIRE